MTIDATPIKPLILGPDGGVDPASTAVTSFSGFVTFYDGTIEVGSVPVSGGKASFTNAFVGGTHQFSARYSGDGVNAMSTATDAVQVTKPADDVFYGASKFRRDDATCARAGVSMASRRGDSARLARSSGSRPRR